MVECYKKRMDTKDGSIKYYYMKKTGGKMLRIGADEYSAIKKRQAGGADTPPRHAPMPEQGGVTTVFGLSPTRLQRPLSGHNAQIAANALMKACVVAARVRE